MKKHDFTPDPHDAEACDLCGETADASIHEMDGEPPDDGPPDDVREPGTVGALFDAAGLRNPPGT